MIAEISCGGEVEETIARSNYATNIRSRLRMPDGILININKGTIPRRLTGASWYLII